MTREQLIRALGNDLGDGEFKATTGGGKIAWSHEPRLPERRSGVINLAESLPNAPRKIRKRTQEEGSASEPEPAKRLLGQRPEPESESESEPGPPSRELVAYQEGVEAASVAPLDGDGKIITPPNPWYPLQSPEWHAWARGFGGLMFRRTGGEG